MKHRMGEGLGLETGRVPGSPRAFGTAACWVGLCHWASPLTVSVWVGVLCPSSQRAGIDGKERRGKADGLISLEYLSLQLQGLLLSCSSCDTNYVFPLPPTPAIPTAAANEVSHLQSLYSIDSITFPPSLSKAPPPPAPRPAWCSPLLCSQEARPNRPLSGSAGPVLVTWPRAPGPLLRA